MTSCKLIIKSKGQEECLSIRKGLGLQALESKTKLIEYDCRKADCGICIIEIKSGMENISSHTPPEADFLRAMHSEANERLACQCRIFGEVQIEVPDLDP